MADNSFVELAPSMRPVPIDLSARDGFADARSAIDWATSEVPALQERIRKWNESRPYALVVEPDPKGPDKFLVAYQVAHLDPMIYVQIGAMLNAIRSALDIAACAMSRRNGVEPTRHTKFPIHGGRSGFIGELKNIETKKWLSKREINKIKGLRPYKGGNRLLYALHHLDIIRKHERFLAATPAIAVTYITAWGGGITPHLKRLKNKTFLYRLPAGRIFNPHKGNSHAAAAIVINEPSLRIREEPAIDFVRRAAARVGEIINLLEGP